MSSSAPAGPASAPGLGAPGLSARLGEAVASSCGSRRGGSLVPTSVREEAAAVQEVVHESARAVSDAVLEATEAARAGLRATAQSVRSASASACQLLRRLHPDPSPEELAHQKASDAQLLGLNLEAEEAKEEGNRLYAAGRYEDALEQYSRARRLDPSAAAYASNAAAALLGLGRRREAVSACCEAASLDACFARPRQRLAAITSSSEALQEALEVTMALSAKRPDCAALRELVEQMAISLRARAEGGALFARGRYSDAEALFSEALERLGLLTGGAYSAPGVPLLLANRAGSRCAQQRYREALQDCERACVLAPEDAQLRDRRDTTVRALNRATAFGVGERAVRGLGKGEESLYQGALL